MGTSILKPGDLHNDVTAGKVEQYESKREMYRKYYSIDNIVTDDIFDSNVLNLDAVLYTYMRNKIYKILYRIY